LSSVVQNIVSGEDEGINIEIDKIDKYIEILGNETEDFASKNVNINILLDFTESIG
jgi:hypothetical protein